jgi:DNA-binding transcriptional LysR family regulator
MAVELRHLRCFLAIVDEGNITRAAQRLHLSQPALSRALAQLEHHLAVRLIDRSTHHLMLTDVGRTFAATAREAVERLDEAVASISASVPPLRFGHSWSSSTHAAAIVRSWRAEFPDRPLRFRRSDERIAGLASGQVDVALVRGPITDSSVRSRVIDNEPRLAAVPADHRLAGRSRVSLADLSAETLVINSIAGTTTLDLWPQPPRPTIGADLTTIDDWLLAIATCSGIGITPASTAALHPHPDVRFIPIDDAPTVSLVLAWPRHQPHPHTAAFVALARHTIEPGRSGPKAPGGRSI